MEMLNVLSPTMDFHEGPLSRVPCIYAKNTIVDELVDHNIDLSKSDWNSYETSWDYEKNPLI